MLGLFQEWGQTNRGDPKLRIAGRWVFPDRSCNLDGLEPGMNVEYETRMGGRDGKLTILTRIRPAPQQNRPNGSGSAQMGSTITDGDILRSVSNVVGSLAAAGQITHVEQIALFVNAAHSAFTNMGKAQAPAGGSGLQGSGPAPKGREPGQDDEPFDDSQVPW